MRLFRFKGGIHPAERKEHTEQRPIERLPLPERLYVPLQQHIGAPAEAVVVPGQRVLKGQLIGRPAGAVSAPVHAPTSGVVTAIREVTAPHPSGLPVTAVVIEADGEDRWAEAVIPIDPFKLEPAEVAARVAEAGIVGMGGAAFPSAVKLNLGSKSKVRTLIVNGGECEPYLTCDDRLMQERPEPIVDGIRIMLHALGAERALVAIENNKPAAQQAVRAAAADFPQIQVVGVPTRYPMGSEKQMIQAVTGKEVPAGKLSAEIGVIVHNVATAYAVHQALRQGRPLVSRIVTVSGGAVVSPTNVEVPLGTPVEALLDYCGGLRGEPARLLLGGPMMGMALPSLTVPVVKGSNGVIALTAGEAGREEPARPCIRCARCVGVCPLGLLPLEMAARARAGDVDGAVDFGLNDCISCGTCTYVCPAGIPLTQYFNYAKGALAEKRQSKQKADLTKRLAQERKERLERQEQAKKEAAAKRKAARAAKAAADSKEPS